MAKRTPRERVRTYVRKRATARGPNARRYTYTPELLAHGRHLYEETDTSIPDIAVDFGIHKTTFERLAKRNGWVRYVPPPRDLMPAVRIALEAEGLEAGRHPEERAQRASKGLGRASFEGGLRPPPQDDGESASLAGGGEQAVPAAGVFPPLSEIHARLLRAALEELAAVEALRARLKREPHSPLDGERTARTLSSIHDTINRIQRSQCGQPTGPDHDRTDQPADIDAQRGEIARRIEAFLASRERSEDADGGAGGGAVARP